MKPDMHFVEIIRAALGVPQSSITHPVLKRRVEEEELVMGFGNSIILEAEMVAFSEKSGLVDGMACDLTDHKNTYAV
jgi:hypothetical protein